VGGVYSDAGGIIKALPARPGLPLVYLKSLSQEREPCNLANGIFPKT